MEHSINWELIKSSLAMSIFHAAIIWGFCYWIFKRLVKAKLGKVTKGLSYVIVWIAASFGTLTNFTAGIREPGTNTFIFGLFVALIVFFFIYFNHENNTAVESK